MSRHPAAAEAPAALSIPKDLWYPTPVHRNVVPADRPRLSAVTLGGLLRGRS